MVVRIACVVALGLLIAVPATEAKKHRPKPVADNVFAGSTAQGLPGYVKVLSHRRGLEVVFTFGTECTDGQTGVLWRGVTGVQVRKGRFHYSHAQAGNDPEVTLDGQLGKKTASGTWHMSFTFPNDTGGMTTCDSGLVSWSFPKSLMGGRTSDGYPLAVDVFKGKVRGIQIAAELKCQSGGVYFWGQPYMDFPIDSGGRFGDSFDDSGPAPENQQGKLRIEVRGRVGKSAIKGTYRVTVAILDAAGAQVDTCDSGLLTWSAAA
jgi:hypothetical protein